VPKKSREQNRRTLFLFRRATLTALVLARHGTRLNLAQPTGGAVLCDARAFAAARGFSKLKEIAN
jgi:hypothetical protein